MPAAVVTLTVDQGPHQGHAFSLTGHDTFLFGRSRRAHLQVAAADMYFSRFHFLVEANAPQCRLLDLDSRNGTYVNGRRVQAADLKDGDRIKVGHTVLYVHVGDGLGSPALVPPAPPPAIAPLPAAPAEAQPIPRPGPRGTCRACGAAPAPADVLCPDCRWRVSAWPQPVPGYDLVRELGRGGTGVVYLGVRTADGAAVAVKILRPARTGPEADVAGLLREVNALKGFDHRHAVGLRDLGEADGLLYFVTDCVPGTDAARLLAAHGPLPVGRAVTLACQMLRALARAHDRGLVHGDVKPSNLLISEEDGREHARLADFGLARAYRASPLCGLAVTAQGCSPPEFMAPEQVANYRDARPAADQYAAAATLYALLTARGVHNLPDHGPLRLVVLLGDDALPIRARRADVPVELAAMIDRALRYDPRDRFPDVWALREALRPFR
jgi:serine/threonine-protein kinase